MSVHMKTHPTKQTINSNIPLSILVSENGSCYKIPTTFYENLKKYEVKSCEQKEKICNLLTKLRWKHGVEPNKVFAAINFKYSKLGAIVRGIRYKENLSQKNFAIKIKVSQTDLSKIENGKRAIGKTIISRIIKQFKINKKVFEENFN